MRIQVMVQLFNNPSNSILRSLYIYIYMYVYMGLILNLICWTCFSKYHV